jgi:hypothetical protein
LSSAAIESESFGNRDRAEPAWIQSVNFTARGGLGNSASPGFAGCCAATGVRVVSYSRDPGARGLTEGQAADQNKKNYRAKSQTFHFILLLVWLVKKALALGSFPKGNAPNNRELAISDK